MALTFAHSKTVNEMIVSVRYQTEKKTETVEIAKKNGKTVFTFTTKAVKVPYEISFDELQKKINEETKKEIQISNAEKAIFTAISNAAEEITKAGTADMSMSVVLTEGDKDKVLNWIEKYNDEIDATEKQKLIKLLK